MTTFSSPVPLRCRFTSGFNPARRLLGIAAPHGGSDWAPPTPGQPGVPIYAVAAGTVTAAGTGVLVGHTGNIVAIDHGILSDSRGADRIRTNYGHLAHISVKAGEHVEAGDQVGIMGKTGFVTGIHLHFGVAQLVDGKWVYFDPAGWLARKGIVPGTTKPVEPKSTVTVVSTAVKPTSTKKLAAGTAENKRIQTVLEGMGLYAGRLDGVDGPAQKAAVKAFQKAHGLVRDGAWGRRTEQKYQSNIVLQKALNAMKSTLRKLVVDGYIGKPSKARIADIKRRNGWGSGSKVTAAFIAQLTKVGAYK